MQNKLSKIIAIALSAAIFSSSVVCSASAETAAISDITALSALNNNGYAEYIKNNKAYSNSTEEVTVSGGNFSINTANATVSDYEGKKNVLLWESGIGEVGWNINIPEDGFYNFSVELLPLKAGPDLEMELLIDGFEPFEGLNPLSYTRDWCNVGDETRTDSSGNELAPEQKETGEFIYRLAEDKTGVAVEPYKFILSKGSHTVTLKGKGYPVVIASVSFTSPESVKSYKEAAKAYNVKNDKGIAPIVIQGEKADIKTDKSLIPKAENNNAGMTPLSPYISKINTIGGSNWSSTGQKLVWKFEVEKSGYYRFGTRFKQNELINGESLRHLKIDGKTPFEEAKNIRFPYKTGWQYLEFSNEETPYYIFLEKGEHTLSLEVTLGELSVYYDRLSRAVSLLGDLYLQIVMITGEIPDTNRDYELFRQIPGFNDTLGAAKKELGSIVDDMKSFTGKQGSQYTAAINNLIRVINQMLEAPYLAHIYVKDFYTNYTSVSSWLNEMKKMPLSIDELRFAYAGSSFGWDEPNLFERFIFGAKRLLNSYTADYNAGKDNDNKPKLKLWINWGRDQTMVLDSLIRDSFTAETDIDVELQIVSNTLINGLLAGNFPDIQLQLARTEPVNLGIRDALYDLSRFEDCNEVLKRFQDGADTPYRYNGKLYALPDTQTFFCMFCRTDVMEQLGLEIPETWDEFLQCATIIQRYNMSVYVPYTQITAVTTVNTGIGSLNLFPTLMLQNNLSVYNEKLNACEISSVEALKVFEDWTSMYSDYGYLKEADFYNRFRNGSMPLGIAPYTTYMTLYSAAPEIKDRWTIANVPGVDGVNNYIAGGGTGCSIVQKTKYPNEAWEFLKWWTSAEIQVRYSDNVESILGMLGRVSTSNVEAFGRLAWNPDDLNRLLNQWSYVKEIEEIPGSYYLSRAVDQAFWEVINDNSNPKDAVTKWSIIANSEIKRKIKEYS